MPQYTTLITSEELLDLIVADKVLIYDCRSMVGHPNQGREEYEEGHIPGAYFLHLNDDLSDLSKKGEGRHPLPNIENFTELINKYGIDPDLQVVVYDQWHGGIAARMWWMLQSIGHEKVAVLDGGWQAWKDHSFETSDKMETLPSLPDLAHKYSTHFAMTIDHDQMVDATQGRQCIIDSRTANRYEGIEEPIDPIAGHIPSALNLPFLDNLKANKKWKSKEELRKRFDQIVSDNAPEELIFYCGSGVTACHNILAIVHIGYPMPKLYVPSWSGWISDKDRPIVTTKV